MLRVDSASYVSEDCFRCALCLKTAKLQSGPRENWGSCKSLGDVCVSYYRMLRKHIVSDTSKKK